MNLNSEQRVNELVDLCHSVYLTSSAESFGSLLRAASRVIHPACSLFLLKFISAYAKKDYKFLAHVIHDLPTIVLLVYQSCDPGEKAVIRMYISGWRMRVSPWPEAAEQTLGALTLFDHSHSLHVLAQSVMPTSGLVGSLSQVTQEGDKLQTDALVKLVQDASERLAVVVSSINQIRSMVGT